MDYIIFCNIFQNMLCLGTLPWSNLMKILGERENNDYEIFVYTMSLINKILNGIPDQDTFFDVVDALEEQQIAEVLQRLSRTQNADLQDQCRLYDLILNQEEANDEIDVTSIDMAKMRLETANHQNWVDIMDQF